MKGDIKIFLILAHLLEPRMLNEGAQREILNQYLDGAMVEAAEVAQYINEKYYSIGFWGLAPGQDECNEGNRI